MQLQLTTNLKFCFFYYAIFFTEPVRWQAAYSATRLGVKIQIIFADDRTAEAPDARLDVETNNVQRSLHDHLACEWALVEKT
jgi:hypothetical protein